MNWGMLGHAWAVDMLKHQLLGEDLRHAYLITGAPGIGRRTLALRFVQALNCQSPLEPGEPCLSCRICQQIERQQYADMSVVQAEQEGKEIKIDQVRSLQHSLSLAPYESSYRVALLLGFHNANANAQNAMLKTLEEAPSRAILLVTSDSLEGLLPTIVSRCEVLRLRPLPMEQIAGYLQETHKLDRDRAMVLAHLAEGRPGFALRLLENPESYERRQALLEQIPVLVGASRRARFAYVEGLTRDREKARDRLRQALLVWLSFWRDVLICNSGADTPLVNLEKEDTLRRIASQLSLASIWQVTDSIENGLDHLDANANPRLVGEVVLLDWPRL
jgi:DNA polymerase-3 subunit delta'